MLFLNSNKDNPDIWTSFDTREEAENYMKRVGGSFSVREGEKFNSSWVNNEIERRERSTTLDFQSVVDREVGEIAENLSVSIKVAGDIWYLRTQKNRWTKELEQKLVNADHSGNPIDSDFVSSEEG
jgi:hypothetical protein